MWNPVALVAKTNRVDPEQLIDFARANEAKYGIVEERPGCPEVNTWHTNDLINDFKEQHR